MGQTQPKIIALEQEALLEDSEPPDPKPPKKKVSLGAPKISIKLQEFRAGAHCLNMFTCVH